MSSFDSVSSESSKPKPCFSHLPWHIKQQIVESTDLNTRFITRKVSKTLMHLVDRSSHHYKEIKFELLREQVKLTIIDTSGETKRLYEAPAHIIRAVSDLMVLLKSTRVTVGRLRLEPDFLYQYSSNAEYTRDQKLIQSTFTEKLNELSHKLHVRVLGVPIADEEEIMFILPHLKAKTLKKIVLGIIPWETDKRVDRLIETDHWKQVELVMCKGTAGVPIRAMALPEYAQFLHGKASLDELKELIQIILESSEKPVTVDAEDLEYDLQEFEEYAQQFKAKSTDPRDRFVPVPNTELFLRIIFHENRLFLTKLTKDQLYKDYSSLY